MKRATTPQDEGKSPNRPGKAVWDTRDRLEAAQARIRDLEDEVARLKRQLAARDPLAASGKPVKRGAGDLSHLHPQDRQYLERRLR